MNKKLNDIRAKLAADKVKEGLSESEEILKAEREKRLLKKGEEVILYYCSSWNRQGNEYGKDLVILITQELQNKELYTAIPLIDDISKAYFLENQDEFGLEKKTDFEKIEFFIKKNYTIKKNVVTQITECYNKEKKQFEAVNANSIYRKLRHKNIKAALADVKAILASDFVEEYNPFEDYFFSLPEHDGVDYIQQVCSHITAKDQDFFNVQFKKMLVRCIKCAIGGFEDINRFIFVLVSEVQELGKSTFIRYLNPFGSKYYTEAPLVTGGNGSDKDSYIRLSENFIYNIEELAGFYKKDVNALKAIISTGLVKQRKAYKENELEMKRRCSFFGSTNNTEFLVDDTNTRWLNMAITAIDFNYSNIDIHKVWAQAYSLYKSGYNAELSIEEKREREAINKIFEVTTSEKDLILRYLRPKKESDKVFFKTNTEIVSMLNEVAPSLKIHTRQVTTELRRLGFVSGVVKINGKTCKGWYVEKSITAIHADEKPDDKPDWIA